MRLTLATISVCVTLCVAFSAEAQFMGENLLVSLPPGFKIGFQDSRGGVRLQEMVPARETVQDWSEMVTVQIFQNRRDLEPRAMLETIQRGWLKACQGSASAPIVAVRTAGYDSATMTLRCPRNAETGKAEATVFRAIKGRDSFYMVQRAIRAVPTSAQLERMEAYVASAGVCDTRSAQSPCPNLDARQPK
jgi:hypothetical protein